MEAEPVALVFAAVAFIATGMFLVVIALGPILKLTAWRAFLLGMAVASLAFGTAGFAAGVVLANMP